MITRIRPSWWLPCLEFCWGLLTLALYKVTDPKQIYALRAFVRLLLLFLFPADRLRLVLSKLRHIPELSCYSCPGYVCHLNSMAHVLTLSQYTPREIAFRIGFYHSCQSIGNMASPIIVYRQPDLMT
jgi:hypothetical protein